MVYRSLRASSASRPRAECPFRSGIVLAMRPSCYQRIRLRSSTDSRRRRRKIATMIASPTATSATRATHHEDQLEEEERARGERQKPPGAPRVGARLLLAGDEDHDRKDEEDHDRAGIDDHLRPGQKLGAEGLVEHGDRAEVHDEEERPVDRIAPEDEP